MNILIIGSSGFIGRNLTKNLVSQKNCSVYGIDIKSNKEFAGKKIYIGNIKESAFLKKCIKESKPNLIYYLISFFSSKNSEDFTNSYGESLAYLKNLFQNLDYSHRYVGSFVADVHRTILDGGIFMYPATNKNKNGKLRLLYEAYPMAFIIDKTGGITTNGSENILDVAFPENDIHERTPLYIMSNEEYRIFNSI